MKQVDNTSSNKEINANKYKYFIGFDCSKGKLKILYDFILITNVILSLISCCVALFMDLSEFGIEYELILDLYLRISSTILFFAFHMIRNYINNASSLYELLNIKHSTRIKSFVYPIMLNLVIIFIVLLIFNV